MDEMMEQHLEEVQVAKSTRAVWLTAGEQSTTWQDPGSDHRSNRGCLLPSRIWYIDWSGWDGRNEQVKRTL